MDIRLGCYLFVATFTSADIQVVKMVQYGAQSPARLHIVHLLAQLDGGKKTNDILRVYSETLICVFDTAVPAAPCSPWSRSHPWADKWCRSCPCTEKERRAGAWSSCCTLQREKEGLVRVRSDNQYSAKRMWTGWFFLGAVKMHSASGAQWLFPTSHPL